GRRSQPRLADRVRADRARADRERDLAAQRDGTGGQRTHDDRRGDAGGGADRPIAAPMPSFAYSARDMRGQLLQGVADGANAAAVADQLIGGGMTPLSITASGDTAQRAPSIKFNWS